jgi:hypothetical protein
MSAAEGHRELCSVYSQNVMSEGAERQCVECLIMGEQMFTTKTVVSDLARSVDQKFVKDGTSQFQNFRVNFTVPYEIITIRLGWHKFCARWVPKMATGAHKTQGMASALTFL